MPLSSDRRSAGGRKRLRWRLPALALACSGGAAGLLFAAVPGESALRDLLRERGILVAAATIRSDGTFEAHDLQAASGALLIKAAEVVASPTSNTISANDVVVTTARGTYRTKRVELTGTALTNADLAGLLDPKSTTSLADRLQRVSAATITMADVTGEEKAADVLTRTTYRDVVLRDVASGRVGTAISAGLSLTQTDGSGAMLLQAAYGPLLAHGIDASLAARMSSEVAGAPGEAKATLFADLSIDATRLFWPKTQLEASAGRIAVSAFRGRRLAEPVGMLDIGSPETTRRQRQQRIAQSAVILLDAFELGTVDIADLRVRDLGSTPTTDITIGKTHVVQPDGDRITTFGLGALKSVGRGGNYDVAEVTATNLDVKSLRDALHAVAAGADTSDLAVRRNLTPVMDALALRQIDADVVDTDRRTGDPAPDRMRFHIDNVDLTEGRPLNGIPSRFNAKLDHLTFAVPRTDAFRPLAEMGYTKLDLSSRFGFDWNEAARELAIDDIALNGVDMGTVRLTAGFSNAGRELFSPDSATVQAAAYGMLLRRLDLRIDNAGLLEKMIARQASADGDPVDDVRQSYVSSAAVGVPILLGNGSSAKAIGAAAAKFVAQPHSFHLVASAPDGIGVSDMQYLSTPNVLLGKLRIEVKANE